MKRVNKAHRGNWLVKKLTQAAGAYLLTLKLRGMDAKLGHAGAWCHLDKEYGIPMFITRFHHAGIHSIVAALEPYFPSITWGLVQEAYYYFNARRNRSTWTPPRFKGTPSA